MCDLIKYDGVMVYSYIKNMALSEVPLLFLNSLKIVAKRFFY